MESVERAVPPDDRTKWASESPRQPILNRLTMGLYVSLLRMSGERDTLKALIRR